MPFLTLGLLVGATVTETVRRLFDHFLPPGEADESGIDDYLGAAVSTDLPTNAQVDEEDRPGSDSSSDPCDSVCRFSNSYKNCWMNASLQAVLNLEVVQKKVTSLHPEHVIQELITPEFGVQFLAALTNPGETFFAEDLYGVLGKLSETLPKLKLLEANKILDFLEPLLMSLNRCEVKTSVEIEEMSRCERCEEDVWSKEETYTYVLPAPGENDSITSLWLRSGIEINKPGRCRWCGFPMKTEQTVVLPDVLTLCVPRKVENDSVAYRPVAPCESLEFVVDESTTLSYRLSSVICVGYFRGGIGHGWTYLFKKRAIVKADAGRISVVEFCGPDCICHRGVYYFYERSCADTVPVRGVVRMSKHRRGLGPEQKSPDLCPIFQCKVYIQGEAWFCSCDKLCSV
ncbi:Hypothetical protein SMAX5B_005039 [Scophthalmus maximus]|uniref:USP domain-containing protein n=1 Tax=Scophthalmus maximus TaxID=52904 RepID=A0A2U9AZI0_SCOMX|nr:uncharacterized protein LOC118301893 [Scophthalmus maximus]XP_035483463.2 uncharacterized protein LOC118301893 [Scophthalmus maximus]XP_035483469.2 uncharacterized protein LOC118301893 [Scophthalmus maximus]XP_035483476.2 uncharacterized protein LOC118301893 [Scophthalmus maximus]AWO97092.1 Hypothetical protein SMAX5B_005039 [Scophthalmus maximus]KAF0044975.1 hypothetical protein F2P81_001504 [Scophthalmus maximus]